MKRKSFVALITTAILSVLMLTPQLTVLAKNESVAKSSIILAQNKQNQNEDPDPEPQPEPEPEQTTPPEPELPAGTPSFTNAHKQTFQIQAGTTQTFNVMFQNLSSDGSSRTIITLKPESSAIDIKNTLIECGYVGKFNYAQFDMETFVPKSTPAGRYAVEATITGVNRDEVQFSQTLIFYINVVNTITDKGIFITDYSVNKNEIKPNDQFTLSLTIENTSGTDIKGVLVDIEGLDGSRFAMDSGLSLKKIDLNKNEKKTITYDLIATKGISSIREVLMVKMVYQLDSKNAESKQETVTNITVSCKPSGHNEGDDKVFAPNIIIDNYTYGSNFVTAGKQFPLNITIRNTSSSIAIQNLKVTIQGASGSGNNGIAFSPANSSNSFFFNNLGANVSKNINIDMLAKSDAVPDSYPIEVTFNYEFTANGVKDKASPVTETLSIPLQQDDRFTANTPELPPEGYVGEELPVSLTFINKGKSAVYNVTVDVYGEGFEKTASAYYIGNVNSGTEEYYDTRIIPTNEGEIKGEIVVTYEDSNGNQKELRTPFITSAMAFSNPGGMGYPGEEEYPMYDENGNPIDPTMAQGGKLPTWAIIAICAGAGVVVIVVIIVIVKIRSRKKLAAILAAEAEDTNENN